MRSNNKPTPVLNLATNKMVLIQMDNPFVVNNAAIRHVDAGEVFVISGEKYQQLTDTIHMPDEDEGLTKAVILDRFKDNTHMDLYILSDDAYEFIYSTLPADMSVQQVLDQVYELLYHWHEDSCLEVLEYFEVEHEHLDFSEKEDLADDLLKNSNLEYYHKMEMDNEAVFLYKGNLRELEDTDE